MKSTSSLVLAFLLIILVSCCCSFGSAIPFNFELPFGPKGLQSTLQSGGATLQAGGATLQAVGPTFSAVQPTLEKMLTTFPLTATYLLPTYLPTDLLKTLVPTNLMATIQSNTTPVPPQAKTPVPGATTGSITGKLSYPSEGIPAMRVAAFNQETKKAYWVDTPAGTAFYTLTNLPAGKYRVVAYAGNLAGGYSKMVPCGLQASCTDHTLIDVVVKAGETAKGIDPADWYAPQGSFPARP